MGGEIIVESEVGKGSRFTIRVPLLTRAAEGRYIRFRDARPCSLRFCSAIDRETANA